MEWIKPKTDWNVNDFFNASDYNRIKNNLLFLKELCEKLFSIIDYSDMGADKDYTSLIYADELNAIERNLELLNANSYDFSIGDTQTYADNGKTPLWSEYNRIEGGMLLLYQTMQSHIENLPRLSFVLGRQKEMRV